MGETINKMGSSMMFFTDCSSSATATRTLPFSGYKFPVHLNLSMIPLHFRYTSQSPITAALATEASGWIIDGKAVAKEIRGEVAAEISRMTDAIGIVPGLAVILVSDRKDYATYVCNKKKACESVGISSYEVCLPEDWTEQEVLEHISSFNDDSLVHGILVQLYRRMLEAIGWLEMYVMKRAARLLQLSLPYLEPGGVGPTTIAIYASF